VVMSRRFVTWSMGLAALTGFVMAAPAEAQDAPSEPTISARVILPSKRLAAGATMKATVRVQNDTGNALRVATCRGPFQVALSNDKIEPHLGWPTCGMPFTIPVGTSTYHVVVAGSYVSCELAPGDATPNSPGCVDGRPPPLPPGKYQAKLYQDPHIVRAPSSITVTVTRGRR
jgi:hypothetical protein